VRRWINVYSPIDLLGSNFRDDTEAGSATRGLTPATPGGAAGGRDIAPDDNIVWDLGVDSRP
jgi:hypothetical protein